MKIGVLALQGAFAEHIHLLGRLGVESREIRQAGDFGDDLDGLILPGGESTVMGRLLNELGLMRPIREAVKGGLPTFGTCAGLILLCESISGDDAVHIGTLHATARRNAWGRQLGSFSARGNCAGIGEIPMVFIRAPYVEKAEDGVEILAQVDDRIVAVRERNMLATAFHPELSDDTRVHEFFLSMV